MACALYCLRFVRNRVGAHLVCPVSQFAGGAPVRLTEGRHAILGVTADSGGDRLALLLATPSDAGDLYVLSGGSAPRRLTELNRDLLAEVDLPAPMVADVPATGGGSVQCWFALPPDFAEDPTPRPAILYIHGGPHLMYAHTLFHEYAALAAAGYTVIFPNPRGSEGYGEAWAAAIRGDWGAPALPDCLACVDHAIRQGWADGDRLGDIAFGQKTAQFYREHIELPFFQRHLKGKKAAAAPEAWVFESGTNEWHTYAKWPPEEVKAATLFFQDGGKLATSAPVATDGDDAWVSDPKKPVPYRGRSGDSIDAEYMTDDQRFAARRPDVLVYESAPLTDDVTIAGPVRPSFWVSTSGTDQDWVVKLIDVYPDDAPEKAASTGTGPLRTGESMGGYQQLVRGDVLRGKFRNSLEKPEPLVPNARTHIEFEMLDVLHTFRKGRFLA